MAKKYLDDNGLLYFWQQLKTKFATKAEGVKTITRSGTTFTVTRADDTTFTFTQQDNTVAKTTTTPKMDGTATIGSETKYAAGDHVHPTDTSRVPTTRTVNGHALSADISLTSSDVGAVPTSRTVNGKALSSDIIVTNLDLGQSYGTCSTATSNTAKVVEAPNYKLTNGGVISVLFSNGTGNPGAVKTLNVNSTGAKYVRVGGNVATSSTNVIIPAFANSVLNFMYNGNNFVYLGQSRQEFEFTYIKVGETTISAETFADTLELVAGSNVSLTPDATNDTVTIAATDTTYAEATTSTAGLMSSTDKSKLDGIAAGAQVNVQSDWNASSGDALILNKPTIPTLKNVFGKVKVGSTTIEADTTQDTLELAGSNVSLTPDATNDKVTIGITSSNVTTALGNTAVARATADASGNTITSTYAPKASPALTGTPTAPTAAAGTNTTQIATTAFVKSAVDTAITGAVAFQGTAPTTFAPTNYKAGWYWVVGTAGTYADQTCEVGDMIFATATAATYSADNFDIIQTNMDITSITNSEIDTILAA